MSDLKKAHCISRLNFEHVRKDGEGTSVSAPENKKLVEANRNAEDSIVFEIVQAFDYHY